MDVTLTVVTSTVLLTGTNECFLKHARFKTISLVMAAVKSIPVRVILVSAPVTFIDLPLQ